MSDLLRKTAELALTDMIQLLFTRLPTFSEENLPLLKKLKMRNTGLASEAKSGRRAKHEAGKTGNYESRKKGHGKKQAVVPATGSLDQQVKKEILPLTLPIADPITPVNSE